MRTFFFLSLAAGFFSLTGSLSLPPSSSDSSRRHGRLSQPGEDLRVDVTLPGSPPEDGHIFGDPSEPLLTQLESIGLRAPSDCRRGNCLSCAARLLPDSSFNYEEDPATFLCREARDAGYILTCSTRAVGPGLKILLEQQSEAFQIQFYDRFEKAREAGCHASSKTMTDYNVRHTPEWIQRTEQQFSSTKEDFDGV